jgi:hypothetical protein
VSGWIFFWCAFVTALLTGIDWLLGSRSLSWSYAIGIFGATFVITLISNASDHIREIGDNAKEIKNQNEKLIKRVEEMEKSLLDIDRKINYLK